MKLDLSSGNYKILDSGELLSFKSDDAIIFSVDFDGIFKFNLKLNFENNEADGPTIKKDVYDNNINCTCYNFSDSGTGTSIPIDIANYKGEKIYFSFWSMMEGELPGKDKVRKITYTFFMGR